MAPSPESQTMVSASKISFAVLISRVLGVIRESLFAKLFGSGLYAEAYVVAYRIPNLLRDLFAEGALSSAFVPTFTKTLKQDGKEAAFAFGNLVLTGVLLITGFLGLLGFLLAPELVGVLASGFPKDAKKYQTSIMMTQFLLPTFTLISLSAVFMGMLNSQRHFFVPAFAPALFNIVSVISGIYLCLIHSDDYTLAILWCAFTVLSTVVQLVCQIPSTWKTGWRPKFLLRGLWTHPDIRKMVLLMLPAVLGVAIVNINVFVNTRFASNIQGGLAHLNYAFRLFYLPVGLFGVAFGTVAATIVAGMVQESKFSELRSYLSHTLKLNWILSFPCTFGLAILSWPTVKLLFERGNFQAGDTVQTSLVLCAYLVGLIPFASVKIFVPTFFSLESPRLPLIASLLAVLTNYSFNYATHQYFGAIGIALGISLATFVQISVLIFFLSKKIGSFDWHDLGIFLLKVSIATLLMGIVTSGVFWGGYKIGLMYLGMSWEKLWTWSLLPLSILSSIVVYFPICHALKIKEVEEIQQLFQKIANKLGYAKARS